MLKCPELRRLQKTPRFSSILWRHQSPGSVSEISTGGNPSACLDLSHPATRWKLRSLPQYKGNEIQLRVFPMALLARRPAIYPFRRPFLTWNERVKKVKEAGIMAVEVKQEPKLFWRDSGKPLGVEQVYPEDDQETLKRARLPECRATPTEGRLGVAMERAKGRVPMSFFITTSKARMGALRCTRRIITLRVKAALNLIVTRGAYYGDETKKNSTSEDDVQEHSYSRRPVMKLDQEEAESMGRKWVLQGWSYIFSPSIEVYRMPYSKLIPLLREILTTVNAHAIEMENKWLANSLLREQRSALQTAKANNPRKPKSVVTRVADEAPSPISSAELVSTNEFRYLRPPSSASAPRKLQSAFDNAAWTHDLETELEILARWTRRHGSERSNSDFQRDESCNDPDSLQCNHSNK